MSAEFSSTLDKINDKLWNVRVIGYDEALTQLQTVKSAKDPIYMQFSVLLKGMINDKNLNAQEKALEVVLRVFTVADIPTNIAAEVCKDVVKKSLGSSRIKIRDFGIKILNMMIETEKHDIVGQELLIGLMSKQPNVVVGCILALRDALSQFGSKVLPTNDMVKAIPKVIENRDKDVREACKDLIFELYRWTGDKTRKLLSKLKPVVSSDLEDRFKYIKDDERPSAVRYLRSQRPKSHVHSENSKTVEYSLLPESSLALIDKSAKVSNNLKEKHVSLDSHVERFLSSLNSDSTTAKADEIFCIARMFEELHFASANKETLNLLMRQLVKLCYDNDPVVRDAAYVALSSAKRFFPSSFTYEYLLDIDNYQMQKCFPSYSFQSEPVPIKRTTFMITNADGNGQLSENVKSDDNEEFYNLNNSTDGNTLHSVVPINEKQKEVFGKLSSNNQKEQNVNNDTKVDRDDKHISHEMSYREAIEYAILNEVQLTESYKHVELGKLKHWISSKMLTSKIPFVVQMFEVMTNDPDWSLMAIQKIISEFKTLDKPETTDLCPVLICTICQQMIFTSELLSEGNGDELTNCNLLDGLLYVLKLVVLGDCFRDHLSNEHLHLSLLSALFIVYNSLNIINPVKRNEFWDLITGFCFVLHEKLSKQSFFDEVQQYANIMVNRKVVQMDVIPVLNYKLSLSMVHQKSLKSLKNL